MNGAQHTKIVNPMRGVTDDVLGFGLALVEPTSSTNRRGVMW
jgi:hypothetical protein